jgi:hypothetical protein
LRKRHRKQHRHGQQPRGRTQETSRVKHDEGIVIELRSACGFGFRLSFCSASFKVCVV